VLKTHQLMRLTGGVKLTFGCITGLSKAQLHVRAQKREDFADMLLDIHLALRPRFTIIDGIIAMEGQGPGSGTPRELGSLFAAHDAVALDVALAERTAHAPRSVYTIAASARRGLVDLDDPYRLAGDPVEADTGFKPVARDMQALLPPWLHRTARNLITARPRLVDVAACTKCGDCAGICGASAISLHPTPVFDDHLCVRCYACRQVCPLCVCERCVAEKTQPQWIESSPHARGNLSWNITRALHLAGRCVDCGECERFCPVGIPLTLVNRKLQEIVAERFDYKVSEDPENQAPIGGYRLDDEQEFIK